VKIDLIFDQPHAALPPPWQVTASTLAGIDDHFWDWALWLWSKPAAGRRDVLAAGFGAPVWAPRRDGVPVSVIGQRVP